MIELQIYLGNEKILSDSFLYELDERDLQSIFDQLTDEEILKLIINKKGESKLRNIAKQLLRRVQVNSG